MNNDTCPELFFFFEFMLVFFKRSASFSAVYGCHNLALRLQQKNGRHSGKLNKKVIYLQKVVKLSKQIDRRNLQSQ